MRSRFVPPEMPNGMPPVTAIVSPGLANPSRVTIVKALSTISERRPNSCTCTACDAMANFHVIAGASDTPEFPIVRKIGPGDLKDALRKGFAAFWAMPSQVFFIGLIYPIAGVILAGFAFGQNMLPLLYPLASGFALVGPFVSIGLYELSRRREQGLPTDWKYAFEVLQSPAIGSIAALGVVLLVLFMAWLFTAQALYEWLYGYRAVESLPAFLSEALTTSRGLGAHHSGQPPWLRVRGRGAGHQCDLLSAPAGSGCGSGDRGANF